MSTTAVPSAAAQKQLKQGKVKKGIFSVIRHLILALLAFIWLVPIAWLLLTSFSTDKGINFTRFVPESFTMWNYVSIMTQPDSVAQFPRWFMNTLVVACFNCVISTCFVLMVAYAISCCRFKGRKLLNTLFMAGLFINVNYIVVPIFLMLRDGDVWLKNHIGSGFLLNNLFILAVVYAATALPFTIYLLSGYFATLPHDFEEAAYIDGASYFSTMTRIIFPMAKPSIITIILFNFLSFWNEYIISMTLMSSTSAPRTLPVGLLNLMQAQQSAAQYGTMYAGLVLVMLPTLILYICVQKQLTQGMTVGGLKG